MARPVSPRQGSRRTLVSLAGRDLYNKRRPRFTCNDEGPSPCPPCPPRGGATLQISDAQGEILVHIFYVFAWVMLQDSENGPRMQHVKQGWVWSLAGRPSLL